jgi:hypothetical protein
VSVRLAFVAIATALLAVLPDVPAAGQETPAAPAVDSARMDRARELTRLTSPYDIMVAANLSGWEAAITRSLALDPGIAKLEEQYPGIGKAGIEAARPLARRYCETFVNRANDRKSQIVAQRLSADEIDEVIRFYRTALGQRAVKQVLANFDFAGAGREIADERARTGTAEVTIEEVKAQDALAARRAGPGFSAPDQLEMMRFTQKPAAKKFAAAREEAEREILQMVNKPDPKFLAAQTEALTAAMLAFAETRKRP